MSGLFPLAIDLQSFKPELPHGFQHAEPGLALGLFLTQQALVDEGGNTVEDIEWCVRTSNRLRTPGDDPRVTLIYVKRGTLTVSNTVPTVVTLGTALATPGAQAQDAIPAETEFTMSAGDANLSPGGSGGELRNDGSEELILLASLIVPVLEGAATPGAGRPTP